MELEKQVETVEQMGSKRRLLVPLLFLIAIITASFFFFCPIPGTKSLVLSSEGRTLAAAPIEPGESFTIDYTHSLNRSPVTDTIEWTGTELIVRTSFYKTFGAGIPVPAEDEGTILTTVDNGFLLTNIDRMLPSIPVFTEEIPDHRVSLRDESYSLVKLVGIQKLVEISVRNITLFELLAH